MNPFSEVVEAKEAGSGAAGEVKETKETGNEAKEAGNKTKGFENTANDVSEPEHIKTVNESMEGKTYPGTDVKYEKRVLRVNGKKVEGVFPEFESKFDICMPKDMWKASDNEQFKYCTEKLKERIENDPEFAKQFTPRQIAQIKDGAPRISGLTWHHNETPGKMQLVDAKTHDTCRHTGGRSIWGGGSGCR